MLKVGRIDAHTASQNNQFLFEGNLTKSQFNEKTEHALLTAIKFNSNLLKVDASGFVHPSTESAITVQCQRNENLKAKHKNEKNIRCEMKNDFRFNGLIYKVKIGNFTKGRYAYFYERKIGLFPLVKMCFFFVCVFSLVFEENTFSMGINYSLFPCLNSEENNYSLRQIIPFFLKLFL